MSDEHVVNITDQEAVTLFQMKKLPATSLAVDFPTIGTAVEIELKSEEGRFKFLADVNRKGLIDSARGTFQLRYNVALIIRRLDLGGSHGNPPGPAPVDFLKPFEGYKFLHQDHVHIYLDGWSARWALPLSHFPEIGISPTDDLYDKMEKFFKYCNIVNYRVNRLLFT
jgi:hypothetical protein